MDRITDAFVWPVRDPDWLAKIAIIGLILLVPIAGQINGLGWMLAAIDRLRAGEKTLPAANFSYLGRGIALFVVNVVYVLAIVVVMVALFIPTIAVYNAEGRGSANGALVALAILLNLLVFSIGTLGSLALYFAMPAIVLATDLGGIASGLNVVRLFEQIRRSPINTLIAGLMLIAVGFVAQLGIVVCVIGVLFTSAYGLAMQAWVVRSYEHGTAEPRPSA
jgi:cytochrome c biogenesis factor